MTSAQFRARQGLPPAGETRTVAQGKPQIRLPKLDKMNATEAQYERLLKAEFPMADVRYEAVSFRLPSGLYTPDFTVWINCQLILAVEVKGGFIKRDSSLSKFKECRSLWRHTKWRFAQRMKDGTWAVA